DQLVALVGKRTAGLLVVGAHSRLAVVDVAGGDDLVARVGERADGRVEVVDVLRLHVLAHDRLPPRAQLVMRSPLHAGTSTTARRSAAQAHAPPRRRA